MNEREEREGRGALRVGREGTGTGMPLAAEARSHVAVLKQAVGPSEEWRVAARKAAHALAELAKRDEYVDTIVEEGAVEALVMHLSPPSVCEEEDVGGGVSSSCRAVVACEHEVEKDAAYAIGLLAVKPEYQRMIADACALPALVALLKRRGTAANWRTVNGVLRRSADAITNLAHENASIKSRVRNEGGIPPLVELLELDDRKVQRAAAGALRTLAFKNDANKNQIVECGALPTLVFMLRSEDSGIHYEAVGVIGNLVHSSASIKRRVLDAGALQPVIGLLSSRCPESQREAALLLGQFATTEQEKVRIVQRGAVRPLIKMLEAPDLQLKEMAAFALGRLAQNLDNQAGIVHDGGHKPLLELLCSRNGSLQHNAAFALYGLADNEDNVADIVKEGGVQRLRDGEFIVAASKECVQKTLTRLKDKVQGRVLTHLLGMLHSSDKTIQRRTASALAHLCREDDQRVIFIDNGGLEILLELYACTSNAKLHKEGASALFTLASKAAPRTPVDSAPPPPTPQIYLGEQYVNSPTLSDVVFLVEGTKFYAHRIALLASSDTFRAMFDGGYKEKEAKDIEIPDIKLDVFHSMMKCIYTGNVDVTPDIAQDLLRVADQYLLDGLKRHCEYEIAQHLTVENVASVYDLAEAYHARSLQDTCVVFVLEHQAQLCDTAGYPALVQKIIPDIRGYMNRILRPRSGSSQDSAAAAAASTPPQSQRCAMMS
ncbi:hypothetical protein CBR_g46594 [Chara braunii]|uniref:BTB domain-containing protein n=1 Tax=Chara braunii TaxID=69332 RepID=A0A388M0R5_CHABU|nr:hypothetical protein CBR_g46594 [Chara braunii]|eukprot:GBG88105.1 hypothetical protein CBR_g46594 [Chara braunii]